MELNINDDLLLIGEANFSFTLSLLSYCDPKYITTSCYESTKEEALSRYGLDLLQLNLNLLEKNRIFPLFGIDACNLQAHFKEKKFQRIIFMFPHVSGRSNLKKNRFLIEKFFQSCKLVLKYSNNFSHEFNLFNNPNQLKINIPSVFITLANGQGGTHFEADEAKRLNKDSWRVNEIAQQSSFILTECSEFKEDKFDYYKSTGFRNQSKSFKTSAGLVHKFEPSLPLELDFNRTNALNFMFKNYFRISKYLISNELDFEAEKTEFKHPLVELKYLLDDYFALNANILIDSMRSSLIKSTDEYDTRYHIKSREILNEILDLEQQEQTCDYFLRASLIDNFRSKSLIFKNLQKNKFYLTSGLMLNKNVLNVVKSSKELSNLKYEIIIYFNSDENLADEFASLVSKFKNLFTKMFQADLTEEKGDKVSILKFNGLKMVEIIYESDELFCSLDASYFLKLSFGLDDERILYSDDLRVFKLNPNKSNLNFSYIIEPYSIEPLKWSHDLSFWYKKGQFGYNEFLDTIRSCCFGFVRSVELIDIYSKADVDDDDDEEEFKNAYCFRLVYQSCDRALSWQNTTTIQYFLRENLTNLNKLCLR